MKLLIFNYSRTWLQGLANVQKKCTNTLSQNNIFTWIACQKTSFRWPFISGNPTSFKASDSLGCLSGESPVTFKGKQWKATVLHYAARCNFLQVQNSVCMWLASRNIVNMIHAHTCDRHTGPRRNFILPVFMSGKKSGGWQGKSFASNWFPPSNFKNGKRHSSVGTVPNGFSWFFLWSHASARSFSASLTRVQTMLSFSAAWGFSVFLFQPANGSWFWKSKMIRDFKNVFKRNLS